MSEDIRLVNTVNTVERFLGIFSCAASSVGLILVFLGTLLNIFGRIALSDPPDGITEISGLILGGAVFLSLSYGQLMGKHVRMETLISHFPPRARRVVDIIDLLVPIALFVFMAWKIGEAALNDWASRAFVPGLTFIVPNWPHQFCAFIGCLLILVSFLTQLVSLVSGFPVNKVEENRT